MSNNREAARVGESRNEQTGDRFPEEILNARGGNTSGLVYTQRSSSQIGVGGNRGSTSAVRSQNNQTGGVGESAGRVGSPLFLGRGSQSPRRNASPLAGSPQIINPPLGMPPIISERIAGSVQFPGQVSPQRSRSLVRPHILPEENDEVPVDRLASTQRRSSPMRDPPILPDVHERRNNFANEVTIQRVALHAKVLIWIVMTIQVIFLALSCVLALLFIIALGRTLIERNTAILLEQALLGCISKGKVSCYAEITRAFFPFDKIVEIPHLLIRIYSSGLANSDAIYELVVPLSTSNPFLLLPTLVFTTALCFIAHYTRNRLVEITQITTTEIERNEAHRQRPEARP
jgi:hypothetical protein